MSFTLDEIESFFINSIKNSNDELAHLFIQAKSESLFRDKLAFYLSKCLGHQYIPIREWRIKNFFPLKQFNEKQPDLVVFKKLSLTEQIMYLWKKHEQGALLPFIKKYKEEFGIIQYNDARMIDWLSDTDTKKLINKLAMNQRESLIELLRYTDRIIPTTFMEFKCEYARYDFINGWLLNKEVKWFHDQLGRLKKMKESFPYMQYYMIFTTIHFNNYTPEMLGECNHLLKGQVALAFEKLEEQYKPDIIELTLFQTLRRLYGEDVFDVKKIHLPLGTARDVDMDAYLWCIYEQDPGDLIYL